MDREAGGPDGPSGPPEPDRAPRRPEDPVATLRASRRAADEARAGEARGRLREQGVVPIEPDARIGVLLGQNEVVVAVRRGVSVDRRLPCPDEVHGVGGDLYVTSRRIVHLGRRPMTYDLREIREAVVAGDQLLLTLDDGIGMAIAVDDPRLLRVQISAARAAVRREARGRRRADATSEDAGSPGREPGECGPDEQP